MSKKIIKLFQITLVATILFSFASSIAYAYVLDVSTEKATNITNVSVTLNGSLDVDNVPVSIWFEYSTSSSLNNYNTVNASRLEYYTYDSEIRADISGLRPDTKYYFRAMAQSAQGTTRGDIRSFRTDDYYTNNNNYYYNNNSTTTAGYNTTLVATTNPASLIENTSVQLNSTITNPGNSRVNSWFEWGRTGNLDEKTTVTSVGTSSSVVHREILSGLAPGTTYYFRAVAENSVWRNNGPILSFTTSGTNQNTTAYTYTTTATNTSTPANTETKTDTTTINQTQSLLEANVLGAGSFLPSSILGWLVLIILIMILLLLIKYLYHDFSGKKPDSAQTHA